MHVNFDAYNVFPFIYMRMMQISPRSLTHMHTRNQSYIYFLTCSCFLLCSLKALRCVDFKSTFKRAYRIYRSKSIPVVFFSWNPTKKCKFLWAPLVPLLGWASKDPINSRSPLHKAKVFFFFSRNVYTHVYVHRHISILAFIYIIFPFYAPPSKRELRPSFIGYE